MEEMSVEVEVHGQGQTDSLRPYGLARSMRWDPGMQLCAPGFRRAHLQPPFIIGAVDVVVKHVILGP